MAEQTRAGRTQVDATVPGGPSGLPPGRRGAAPALVRQVNRSVVLDTLKAAGPMSRAELARRAALTKPAVSAIVGELLAEKLVVEAPAPASRTGRGRPGLLVAYNAAATTVLGAQIGPVSARVAIADGMGREFDRIELDKERLSAAETIAAVIAAMRELLDRAGIDTPTSIGVCVPGFIDAARGVVLRAPMLDWGRVELGAELEDVFQAPVFVHDETQAAAVAEAVEGAARDAGDAVVLDAGGRIAAALLLGGRLQRGVTGIGATGFAHTPFPGATRECSCGRIGCLEAYGSTDAMVRAMEDAIARGEPTVLAQVSEGRKVRRKAAQAALFAGDPLASRIALEHIDGIAYAAAGIVNVVNPAVLVFTGALGEVPATARYIGERALALALPEIADAVEVRVSEMGMQAWVRGAILLALQEIDQSYRVIFGRQPDTAALPLPMPEPAAEGA